MWGDFERTSVFDELPMGDLVAWTAVIAGYVQKGLGKEALNCFSHMQEDGIASDPFTFTCIFKACAITGSSDKGEHIHVEVDRLGVLRKDIVLGNAIIDMYVKCGMLAKAKEVLYKLPMRDPVPWTALIAGYAQHDLGNEALTFFEQMREEELYPDPFTFAYVLKACGTVGLSKKGEDIHAEVRKKGLLKTVIDSMLGNILIDMYIKCGMIKKAQEVFDELPIHDAGSWTTLMAGYAQLGQINRIYLASAK